MSKTIAASTIDKIVGNIKDRIHQYLKEHSNEAFTPRGLGHILSINKHAALIYLINLEKEGFVSLRMLNKGQFDFWLRNYERQTLVWERSTFMNRLFNVDVIFQ